MNSVKAKYVSIALAASFLVAWAAPAMAAPPSGNINLLVGNRRMVDSGWKTNGTVEGYTLGIDFDFAKDDWPVALNVGLLGFRDSASKVTMNTNLNVTEVAVGARMYFGGRDFVRPYAGAGLEIMDVSMNVEQGPGSTDSKDRTTGYYLNAGAVLNFFGVLNVGLDARWIGGTKPGKDISSLDSYQASFVIGMSL
ncbi:MAG: outer membrane beta-barrel protein [Nitrospinota bacterium]|nr:outer membrane beta-barrel protein [Nitrospinota bacterium]